MITALEETVISTLIPQTCGECGVLFGLEKSHRDDLILKHGGFFCPNGHSRRFVGETEADRLRAQLQRTENCLTYARQDTERARSQRDTANHRLRSTKGVVTRMKRRITKGRCVCCSKQFKDLETHMKEQHPKWSPEKAAEALSEKAITTTRSK